ncbi:LacI family DNA-binding transcriptional regulator [Microbacterium sp. ProA8]|uniref:LacI family DNA-binding transcriptional regulator n=1 Tax=Microbacterium chionoecetis TaxID=3153754 RepID=UPI0032664882
MISTTTLRRRPADSVGIDDVAAFAGVSPSTVSNVLNHPERVSPSTQEKVRRAIAVLRYVPNGAARSLAAGGSRTVGLALSDLGNSLFVDIAQGAETHAGELGASVILANSGGELERERRALAVFEQSLVLGSLLTLNDAQHFRAIASRAQGRTPLVMLNYHDTSAQFCSAFIDNAFGGQLATKHLLDQGRRRLVFVGGPASLQPVADRRDGFLRALAEVRLAPVDAVQPDWINRADGWNVGRSLAPRVAAGEIDGVVAASDLLAAGILQAFAESPAISLPDDVSVIGYDNNQAAWDAPVPLSTISQPGEELGATGIRLLMQELEDADHEHEAVRLVPTLVERRSTQRG